MKALHFIFFKNIQIVFLSLLSLNSIGQANLGISYQALIRNSAGQPIANSNVVVRFSLRDDSTTGSVIYQELQELQTNNFGLVNTVFGNGIATIGQFGQIDWSSSAKFIQVEANDGQGFQDMGTQQMISVPFAFYSPLSREAMNCFSSISIIGDTLYTLGGDFLIIPGISRANYKYGCNDSLACNYDAQVEYSDNSCKYLGGSCNDGLSITTNDSINSSCRCNGECINCIGQFFQGGYVFYLFQPGDADYIDGETHGLIAAPGDFSPQPWGCAEIDVSYSTSMQNNVTSFNSIEIGAGELNTQLILEACPENCAARSCYNLVLDNYDDWYLPSLNELIALYNSQIFASSCVNPYYCYYQTSNESNTIFPVVLNFLDGTNVTGFGFTEKFTPLFYRPIRKF